MRASLPKVDFRQTAAMFPSRQAFTGRSDPLGVATAGRRSVTARACRRCSRSRCPPGTGVHAAVHWAPVVLLSGAQVAVVPVPHRWKPVLQARTQAVPLHVTVPFVGAVQVRHDAPQASTVLLATQVGAAAVPRRQKPGVLQTTRQLSAGGAVTLSHAAMPFAGGAGQAVQEVPHEVRAVLATQGPVPAGQRWNPGLAGGAARIGRADGLGVGIGGVRAGRARRRGPALQGAVVGEAAAGRRAGVGAGAASDAAGRVDASAARRTRRAIDPVPRPAGVRRVVADADAVAEVEAGVAVPGRTRPRRCRLRSRCRAPCRPCTSCRTN